MTDAQRNDIECVRYFIPDNCSWGEITEQDELDYLAYSERGLEKSCGATNRGVGGKCFCGYHALLEGKRYRGINIHELWEPSFFDGSWCGYHMILGGYSGEALMPRVVVDFLKKEIFQGHDAEVIETTYQEVLEEKKQEAMLWGRIKRSWWYIRLSNFFASHIYDFDMRR